MASVTHQRRQALRAAGRLDRYCELAEQDTLNVDAFRWRSGPTCGGRSTEAAWNYMATERGGHHAS